MGQLETRMPRVLLDNERWDFPTNCFVCESKNERGLGIPFYLDEERREVAAEFTPEVHHSGAPNYAHGGFSMALLDEGMSWATIAIARRWAVTLKAEVEFPRMVRVGQPHTAHAWDAVHEGDDLAVRGEIRDKKGRVCVVMSARFHVLSQEQANDAVGTQAPSAFVSES
jgi:acyl-coenzyme A thioesterase PaaI-like protein